MVFINKEQASSFLLSRNRRANTGVEEFGEGNVEQECMEEVCNYEEAREIFEADVPGLNKFWANYINPTTTPPPTTKPPKTEARMHSEDSPDTATTIWPIIVLVLVVGCLFALVFVCWRRRKSKKSEKDKQQETNDLLAQHRHVDMGHSATGTFGRYELDLKPIVHSSSSRSQSTQQSNSSGGPPPPYGDQRSDSVISSASRSQYVIQDPQLARDVKSCLIDRKKVTVGELLKEGNFGAVYKGILNNHGREQRIAIKSLKCVTDSSSFESFMREGVLMKEFNHPHVLSLIGVCEGDQSPKLLLPFCEKGDLRAYLRDPKIVVTVSNLVKFCQEICDGMAYLASKKFVHRDLAARNCMVDNKCRIKVSDFGLSRVFANERDYYRAQSTIELPLKWMAPESIKFNYYNEKTDVWSFGITCWEVFSRAIIPYPTVEAQNILTYLDSGKRLAKPAHCPDEIYEMMDACWREKGEDRPTFNEIKPVFEAILGRAHQVPERQKNRYSEPPKAYNKAKAVGRSNTERPSSASPYDKNYHQGSMIPQNGFRSIDRRDRPRPKERTLR